LGAAVNQPLCRLHAALGHAEPCTTECCPFWEPGGAVLEGRCAFEQLDLAGRPELAALLLRARQALANAQAVLLAAPAERTSARTHR
jgi:hypothetical protein